MICPSCRQDAPTIVRGVRAYCTSCGAPRPLLGSSAVNVAGKPMKVGGAIASGAGWATLIAGSAASLGAGLITYFIFLAIGASTAGTVGLVVGGFFGILTVLIALSLLLGGRKLSKTGVDDRRKVLEQGIFALAGKQRGSVTPRDVARQLSITDEEADALLTDLVRKGDGRVALDVDDDGTLRYTMPELLPAVRIDPDVAEASKVRVAPGAAILDAEFEDEDEGDEGAEKERDRVRR
ncbi:MAG: hypothetical protein ABI134_26130 [Byssovorax sp.]